MSRSTRDPSGSFFGRWVRPLMIGLAIGIVCCTVLLMLMSALIRAVDIPRAAILPLAITAAAAGAFCAGLTAGAIAHQRGLLIGAIGGVLLFLIILAAGFARYAGVSGGNALIKLAALVLAGGLGGVLGVNRKKH